MKNIKPLIPSFIALLLLFTSCSRDIISNDNFPNVISESRNIEPFNGIESSHGININLSIGDNESVTVRADSSIMKSIITENNGNILKVYVKNMKFKIGKQDITVNIAAKNINSLEASSGSFIDSKDTIITDKLNVTSSSGSRIHAPIKTIESTCNVSSGANVNISGITKNFKGDASSGSKLNAQNLSSVNADLDVSSGANISIAVKGNLKAAASSGGSINYKGSPTMKDIDKSSGGSVSGN